MPVPWPALEALQAGRDQLAGMSHALPSDNPGLQLPHTLQNSGTGMISGTDVSAEPASVIDMQYKVRSKVTRCAGLCHLSYKASILSHNQKCQQSMVI